MPEAVAERTLPHNLDAERSVLGAILIDNHAFNLAAEVIDSGDFYRDAHRRVFDAMVKLAERGNAIDGVTLKDELTKAGELDEIGGGLTDAEASELVATIKELQQRRITIVWIEHIVHILLQVAQRLVCMDAGRVIADGDPATVMADRAVVEAYLGGSVK